MDTHGTVNARLAQVGLDATVDDPRRRIPAAAGARPARELPQISVDLRLPEEASGAGERTTDLEVLGLLGKGGMGRVLLARQHSLDREVAIKTLHEQASAADRASLLSEGTITGHLEHPAIVPVHALGRDAKERPVLVMKRVVGVDWAELIERPDHEAWEGERRDRLEAHLGILMQVCTAAHFAHSRGVVHRDIKPQNVLIGRFGEVYLGDWGLAVRRDEARRPEPLCGTPSYMAPEMVTGRPVDARTDVFLLGATLHRILTGEPRNPGGLHAALSHALEIEPYAYPPSVHPELAAIANRATAREPADRYPTALGLRQAVDDYLHHRSSHALAASALERLARLRELAGDEAGLADEVRQHELDLAAAEIRFALDQARREWPDNPAARQAQEELDQLLAGRRARAAALERQARENDPRVSQLQRTLALAALAIVGAVASLAGLRADPRAVTVRQLFLISLAPLGMAALTVVVARRHVLRTAFNRRASAFAVAAVGGITASRGLGLLSGASMLQVLLCDLLIATVVVGLGAVLMFRWLAFIGAGLLAAAVAVALVPAHGLAIFSAATGGALVLAAVLTAATSRR